MSELIKKILAFLFVFCVIFSIGLYSATTIYELDRKYRFTDEVGFSEYDVGSVTSVLYINWANGNIQRATLTETVSSTEFSPPSSKGRCQLILDQDSTGGRTVSWPASVDWPLGGDVPILSTTGDSTDFFSFYYDGNDYYGLSALGF